jgi:hypothetical protein
MMNAKPCWIEDDRAAKHLLRAGFRPVGLSINMKEWGVKLNNSVTSVRIMSAGLCEIIPRWRKIDLVQEATLAHEGTDTRDEATGVFWSKMSWMAAWSRLFHTTDQATPLFLNSTRSPPWMLDLGSMFCAPHRSTVHSTLSTGGVVYYMTHLYFVFFRYFCGLWTLHRTQHTLPHSWRFLQYRIWPQHLSKLFSSEVMIILICLRSRVTFYVIKLIEPGSWSYLIWAYTKLQIMYHWVEDVIGSTLLTLRLW